MFLGNSLLTFRADSESLSNVPINAFLQVFSVTTVFIVNHLQSGPSRKKQRTLERKLGYGRILRHFSRLLRYLVRKRIGPTLIHTDYNRPYVLPI